MQLSLTLRGFQNLRGLPKNKNTSLGPYSGQEHRNFTTAGTGLRALQHDGQEVQGAEASITVFLQRKQKHSKNTKTVFWGVSQ
jgi:hypothetical protein